ncbi:hypothetical protein CAPTEDRAFT_185721 [Capitella teleta]|uniref:Uncharacterized protein n=1 Tax=Capitella teleta TaxID=283909 RepID=R7UQ84_CAPTE|nr:hypothetical protein CAPTEDRAFT_185721 [Capitella teleta]|eukprot:ELU08689.1 hypothetical protein CAPTEDRAFT_185721 [Capitella teleta]
MDLTSGLYFLIWWLAGTISHNHIRIRTMHSLLTCVNYNRSTSKCLDIIFSCIKPRTHSSHNRYLTHIFQRHVPSSNEGVTTQPPSGYFPPDSPTWQWLVFLIFGVASFLLMAGMAIWYCVLRATKTRVTPDDSHGQEKLEEGSTTSLDSKRDGVPPRNYAYNRRDSRKLTIRKWYSLVD